METKYEDITRHIRPLDVILYGNNDIFSLSEKILTGLMLGECKFNRAAIVLKSDYCSLLPKEFPNKFYVLECKFGIEKNLTSEEIVDFQIKEETNETVDDSNNIETEKIIDSEPDISLGDTQNKNFNLPDYTVYNGLTVRSLNYIVRKCRKRKQKMALVRLNRDVYENLTMRKDIAVVRSRIDEFCVDGMQLYSGRKNIILNIANIFPCFRPLENRFDILREINSNNLTSAGLAVEFYKYIGVFNSRVNRDISLPVDFIPGKDRDRESTGGIPQNIFEKKVMVFV